MPKTRNVTRAQWDSANASHASATRSRKDKENAENEKENGSRQVARATRSQAARGRTGVLGGLRSSTATTGLGQTKGAKLATAAPTKTQTAAKGKGKPKASPVKRKKMPLQDITSQFLPAPEPANRGVEHQDLTEEDLAVAHAEPANIISASAPVEPRIAAPKFTSPLPPSSPPSPLVSSPVIHDRGSLAKSLFTSPTLSLAKNVTEVWAEIDNARPAAHSSPRSVSSASDPFGFVALERRLKVERETVVAPYHDANSEDDDDELGHVLVADTSSPHPVPRLKRSFHAGAADEANEAEGETEPSGLPQEILPHVHYATPPTPHKDKQKRPRLSHEGHDIFSPCESSVESSPSPTKSARKRAIEATYEDPLDEFNEELERSQVFESERSQVGKKTRREESVDLDAVSRHLRTRVPKPVAHSSPKRTPATKAKAPKKAATKSRTAHKKEKAEASGDEDVEDREEKWERERKARVEYFESLNEYEVEQESVYFI